MKLYIMQHGDAVSKEENPDRPLSSQGIKDVEHIAQFVANAGVGVKHVIHSGKTRALQTAEIMANAIAPQGEIETNPQLNPNDPVSHILEQINQMHEDILITGHLPFVAKLVAQLVSSDENNDIVAYTPGSIVCLEPSDRGWSIAWMIRPAIMKQ